MQNYDGQMSRQERERDVPVNDLDIEEVDVLRVTDELVEINLACDGTSLESVQVQSGPGVEHIARAGHLTVASRITVINLNVGPVRVQEVTNNPEAYNRLRREVQDFLVAIVRWPDHPEASAERAEAEEASVDPQVENKDNKPVK